MNLRRWLATVFVLLALAGCAQVATGLDRAPYAHLPIDCIVEWQSRRLCFPPLRRVVIASIDDDRGKPSDLSLADKLVGDRLAGAGGPVEPRAPHATEEKAADDGGLTAAAVLDGRIDDWSVMSCRRLKGLG